mgnify:CR=1 FL=1
MEVWDPKDKITVLSQIKKAIGAQYQGLKGMTRVVAPGILIVFYFFIFFLLLSGCAGMKWPWQKEEVAEPNPLVIPPIEFICTKIDCGDEDIDKLVEDEQNTIACIKLQPECKPNE